MNRENAFGLLSSLRLLLGGMVLSFASLLLAQDEPAKDEPPVRMKKKDKPTPDEPDKPAAEKPKEEKPKQKPTGSEQAPADDKDKEIIDRLNKSMRTVEERLAKKDPGEGTMQLQKDIIHDLDALIEQKQKQNQQQQQQQQKNSSQQKSSSKAKDKQAKNTPKPQPQPSQPEPKEGSKPKEQPKEGQEGKDGKTAKDKQDSMNKMADVYKDIWGHLPESRRQEMDAYAREQFMSKYQDLLKQYYTTMSEKGRRKGD